MTPAKAGVHTRQNLGVLAELEKRTLAWLAIRLPIAVNADHLSATGLVAMAAAGLSFAAFPFNAGAAATGVVLSLAANWFGDSLDGTVARVRNQQRPRYGFYVDHVIDLAGTTMLLGGMAASGLMQPMTALAVLAAYLLVSSESYLATHAAGIFRMSFMGFGPTELRIVLAIGAIKASLSPSVTIGALEPIRLFDIGGVIAAGALLATFILSALRNTRALYEAEPMPLRQTESRVA